MYSNNSDDSKATSLRPGFTPAAALEAAALRNVLQRAAERSRWDALRAAAQDGPEDDRPTIPAPAPR